MIRAEIVSTNDRVKLKLNGHADHNAGFDVVCGMVSLLVQANLQAIEDYTNITTMDKGEIEADIYRCRATDTIVNAIRIGLRAVHKEFPKNMEIIEDDNRGYSI